MSGDRTYDGFNIAELLEGKNPKGPRNEILHYGANNELINGIRMGDWKLVRSHKQPWELYNLGADRTELNDLAATHPERVEELKAAWEVWAVRAGVLPWPINKKK